MTWAVVLGMNCFQYKTGVVKFTEAFAFQGALVALFAYLGFA